MGGGAHARHEDVDRETLGGASTHTTISGVAHLAAPDEAEAIGLARRILGYLPQNNVSQPPRIASTDPADRADQELDGVVPAEASTPYDMRRCRRVNGNPAAKD